LAIVLSFVAAVSDVATWVLGVVVRVVALFMVMVGDVPTCLGIVVVVVVLSDGRD
jgi:hypothetical protein